MTTQLVLSMLVLGGAGGVVVGRWWAEYKRARFDQERIWDARKNYRRGGRPGSRTPPPPTL